MAKVRMQAGFRPGTEVKLVKRLDNEHHVAGDVIAIGTVDEKSVLEIDGLDAGAYWAVTEDQGTTQVTAKGDGDGSQRTSTGEHIDGPIEEDVIVAPPSERDVLTDASTGARETARAPASKDEIIEPESDGDGRSFRGARTTASARPTRPQRGRRS